MQAGEPETSLRSIKLCTIIRRNENIRSQPRKVVDIVVKGNGLQPADFHFFILFGCEKSKRTEYSWVCDIYEKYDKKNVNNMLKSFINEMKELFKHSSDFKNYSIAGNIIFLILREETNVDPKLCRV